MPESLTPSTLTALVPKLSGVQKAAIILIALGPAESANVLRHIPEEEADAVARAVARFETATPEQLKAAFEEFEQFSLSRRLIMRGGMDYAQKLLVEAYGPDGATRLIERLTRSLKADAITFENFRKVDPQQLAKFIQDEHPQTIALILSNLEAGQAATLLSSLPVETRAEVAERMADLDQISPEVVRNIASVIDQKLRNLGELSREAVGGVRAVANMFNRLDPNTCSQMLDSVEKDNPALFENIRRFMFVFRDLENLDIPSIRTLMTKVERSTLLTALKGADESLRQKFLSTQSQRGADMMAEELPNLGPVRLKDVDAAQQQTITIARDLEKEGLISLSGSANDQYVY
jgi:flagellar motor switch protein FliG